MPLVSRGPVLQVLRRTAAGLTRPLPQAPTRKLPVTHCVTARDQQQQQQMGAGTSASMDWSETDDSSTFFDRTRELALLQEHLQAAPTSITMILGPESAGKTRLLAEVLQRAGLADSRFYVNGRGNALRTPAAMAESLMQPSNVPSLVLKLISATGKLGKATLGGMELSLNVPAMLEELAGTAESPDKKDQSLRGVLDAYTQMLAEWKEPTVPVLVIDEANALSNWSSDPKLLPDLKALLSFWIKITKEAQTCHVVLATAKYSFLTWLGRELGGSFFRTFVVGNFAAPDARQFLDQELRRMGDEPVDDVAWEDVWQVCGGNAGVLRSTASALHVLKDRKAALQEVSTPVWAAMRRGVAPEPGDGFTAVHFEAAAEALLESPYNAVPEDAMVKRLGSRPVLDALMAANLLAMRPYSAWAVDIPPEAFGPDRMDTLVTAPTPVALHLMRQKRDVIQEAAQAARALDAALAAPAVDPEKEDRSQKLSRVTKSLEGVERAISSLDEEIQAAKQAGDKEELSALRTEKEHLRKEKEQLRDQEGLLLESVVKNG